MTEGSKDIGPRLRSDRRLFSGLPLLIARSLTRDRSRLLTTVFAIAIGIALLVSVEVIVDSTLHGVSEATQGSVGNSQVTLLGGGGGLYGLAPDVVDEARLMSGVEAAVPVVQANAQVQTVDSHIASLPLSLVGIDMGFTAGMDTLHVVKGRLPSIDAFEIVLPVKAAATLKAAVGAKVLVDQQWAGNSHVFEVVGLASLGGAEVAPGLTAFIPLKASMSLVGPKAGLTDVQLKLRPGVDSRSWISAHASKFGFKTEVIASSSLNSTASSDTELLSAGLASSALASLIAALLWSSMALSVRNSKRSKSLGSLRAIGMSTKQALGFMVGEALVIGLLAGLLGTFLGVMLGILMIEFNSNAFNFPVDTIPLTLPWIALSVSVLVGGLVSILSALVSVRRHSRLSPVEALRGIMKPSARSRSLLVALIGVALIVAGIGLGSISQSPYHLLLIAGSLLFGSVLVVPLLPRPLAFLMSKVMWGAAPAIGILVFSHMKRERSRIASMISLIMVTLALYLTASGILGGEKTNDLVHSRIPVEFPVQGPSMNQTSFQLYQAASGVKSVSIADEENSGYFINDYPFTVTGLTLVDPDALDSAQLHMFQAVAALIGTVCFFSIASALIISGIERNRETALLRAAGATPRLVASIVITESLALGLTALVVAVGTAAIVLDSCSHLLEKFEGYKPIFPWGSLPKVAVIVIVATSISALLPALRSARVSPVLAVRGD